MHANYDSAKTNLITISSNYVCKQINKKEILKKNPKETKMT